MVHFNQYKRRVTGFRNKGTAADVWRQIYDWYQSDGGRTLFVQAFMNETGIRVNPESDAASQIKAALPKSLGDYSKKVKSYAYYRALAEMFIIEMDSITSRVPRECDDPAADFAYDNVWRFVEQVLLDSLVLFEDWSTDCAGVPQVFGVGKNKFTHPLNFYHGAHQTIYGHGSFGLSFSENHSELAVATIRQAVEIRLRRAFGLIGKEAVSDHTFHPVAISELLDVLEDYEEEVQMPVPRHHLVRINHWANLLLHSGMRHYAWTPPRVLDYLRSFLIGGENVDGRWTVHSGIRLTRASFEAIQEALKKKVESCTQSQTRPRFKALLLNAPECDVVLNQDFPTPAR